MSLIRVNYHGVGWDRLDLCLRLASYILKEGSARGARRVFEECGFVVCCDEAWFPKPNETAYRLSAEDNDWMVELCFVKNIARKMPKTPHLLTRVVKFQGEDRKFVRAEVTNPPAFENALTLLRMFGPEEVFSGNP